VIVVALDTATSAVTSGVVRLDPSGEDGARPAELAATYTLDPRAHAELLIPQLVGCLHAAGLDAGDVDAVVVGCGPGPFTGLRVGMATAAGYADALGVPCHPVVTLDAIATTARWALADAGDAAAAAAPLLVVTDARRREAYYAAYDAGGARTQGPAVLAARDISSPVADDGTAALACGDPGRLAELAPGPTIREDLQAFPAVSALVARAAEPLLSGAAPAPLEPLYLRRPDAVEPKPRPISPALTGRDADSGTGTDADGQR
jgi:tRNA threonylcarbamoyl adenosine modification protein YeaZ